jgi:adenylyltransferase/sulfurtransferase
MGLPPLSSDEIARYSRHLLLPQVGMRGQQQLKSASVLIVGAGGLGSPIAMYLAAAGVGRIGLVDYDRVDVSNLQRQVLYTENDLQAPKAEIAAKRLSAANSHIRVDGITGQFNSSNAMEIARGYDILVDGTDNLPTRYLLNDLAVLTNRPYVYGSIFRFEGQVSIFGMPDRPCYRCLFPEPPPPGAIPSCSSAGVMGVLPGIIGSIQAAEVIKLITGIGELLAGRLLLFDALEMRLDSVRIGKKAGCPVCGTAPTIRALQDYEAWCGSRIGQEFKLPPTPFDISPLALSKLLTEKMPVVLLDVREEFERQISTLTGSVHIPLPELLERIGELPADRKIIAYCRNGIRSQEAARLLQLHGHSDVRHLEGGINAWAAIVDPSIPVY